MARQICWAVEHAGLPRPGVRRLAYSAWIAARPPASASLVMLAARNPNVRVCPVTVRALVRCSGRYTIAADLAAWRPRAGDGPVANAASRGAGLGYSCCPVR